MAFSFGEHREAYLVNTRTGKIRKLSDEFCLLVEDNEIDYDFISKKASMV